MYHNPYLEKLNISSGRLLLSGQYGLFQLEDAKMLASSFLYCKADELSTHPDYIVLGDGKKTLTTDMVGEAVKRLSLKPSRAQKHVFLIDGMNLMTVAAQNKLLKLIEEWDAVFILISYGVVLPTVSSRCMEIPYRPYSLDYYKANGLGEEQYYATGGCPALVCETEVLEIFQKSAEIIRSLPERKRELFSLLGLVKEKDKQSFYEKYREYVSKLFCYWGDITCGSGYSTAKQLSLAINNVDGGGYTAADFFKDVVLFIESICEQRR